MFVCSAAVECETTGRSPESALIHSVTHKNTHSVIKILYFFNTSHWFLLKHSPCLCAVAVVCRDALSVSDFLSASENESVQYSVDHL